MSIFFNPQTIIGRSAILAALLSPALVMQPVEAHEYAALIKAKKYAEVERATTAKLATEANNADALVAKTELILIEGKTSRLDEGIKIAEQCIASNPKNSECHEALGNVLGIKAQKGGMMSAVSSLGTIRDSFKKAIELDPKNFNARSSLVTFYLEVPGLMGGSTSKAKELIVDTNKINPAAASLLQAKLDLKEENVEKARTGALAVNASGTPVIAEIQNDVLLEIGRAFVIGKKLTEGEKMFREVIQRFPDSSAAYLGLGRALQEQGKHKEALPQLEKSLSIDASAAAFYRLGKVWQALGEKVKAVSAFEKSLTFVPELGKKTRADAEEQLKLLK
jgi:tetratricopeptide (TPR) repeat protein